MKPALHMRDGRPGSGSKSRMEQICLELDVIVLVLEFASPRAFMSTWFHSRFCVDIAVEMMEEM